MTREGRYYSVEVVVVTLVTCECRKVVVAVVVACLDQRDLQLSPKVPMASRKKP